MCNSSCKLGTWHRWAIYSHVNVYGVLEVAELADPQGYWWGDEEWGPKRKGLGGAWPPTQKKTFG